MPDWKRNTPWRQGHVLSPGSVAALGLSTPESSSRATAIAISHDCDLAQDAKNEPNVEIILGRIIDSANGNFSHSKNPRCLHLSCTGGTDHVVIELLATAKRSIPKEGGNGLARHAPDQKMRLTPKETTILQHWLAARYRRAAFPDEFDRRLDRETGLREALAKILKPTSTHIRAVYFDVDEGEEHHRKGEDDCYALSIFLLYSTEIDPAAAGKAARTATQAIEKVFKSKCCPNGREWKWIELIECVPIADRAMSVQQSLEFKQWHADHISLRGDPPHPMIGE